MGAAVLVSRLEKVQLSENFIKMMNNVATDMQSRGLDSASHRVRQNILEKINQYEEQIGQVEKQREGDKKDEELEEEYKTSTKYYKMILDTPLKGMAEHFPNDMKTEFLNKALSYAVRSYKMRNSIFGETHTITADSIEFKGDICKKKGDNDNAIKSYQQCFKSTKRHS